MDMQNRNRLSDVENKLVVMKGEGEGGGANKGYGINKLLCIKQISNKDILYSTEKYSHYFVITLNGV